jgi:hypothetical protein
VGSHRLSQTGEDIAAGPAAGLDDRQHPFDEPAAGGGLGADTELSPDDGLPQRTLGGVIGWLDALDFGEGPEVLAVFPEFLAETA